METLKQIEVIMGEYKDLEEGKMTLPLIYAIERAPAAATTSAELFALLYAACAE